MTEQNDPERPERSSSPRSDAPAGTASVGGAIGGAIAGAAIGTVAGPVGTAVGATIGAIAGGLVGKAVGGNVQAASPSPPTAPDVASDHEIIAVRAYYIWEGRGRSDGHSLDDWLQAESSQQSR